MKQVRRFVRASALADYVQLLPPHVSKAAAVAAACPTGGVHHRTGVPYNWECKILGRAACILRCCGTRGALSVMQLAQVHNAVHA